MRISKELSYQMADAMMKNKFEKEKEAYAAFKEAVTQTLEGHIPQEITIMKEKFEPWISISSYICIDGRGFNRLMVELTRPIPMHHKYKEDKEKYHPTEKEAKQLITLLNAYEKIRDRNKDMKAKIRYAIWNLKTFANVKSAFPEAAPFLPKEGTATTALIPDLSKLRKDIIPL